MGAQQFVDSKGEQAHVARVALPTALLEQLIISGNLPGNLCQCLDQTARKTLWKSMLLACEEKERTLCL